MFEALVTKVSIAAAFVLTAALYVVIAEGTAVLASAFLIIYQSVSCSIPAASCLITLIFSVKISIDCTGYAYTSDMILAIDYVEQLMIVNGRKSIINLSFGISTNLKNEINEFVSQEAP